MFKTCYKEREPVFSNKGDRYLSTYVEAIDKNGHKYLKKSGDINVYEKIQASLEETKVYNILEQFAQSGDSSIINRRESIFGDFVDVPKTPLELQNVLMKADSAFESLDKDVRAAFDFDAGKFKQSILDNTFIDKIAKFKTEQQTTNTQTTNTQTTNTQTTIQTQQQGGINLYE